MARILFLACALGVMGSGCGPAKPGDSCGGENGLMCGSSVARDKNALLQCKGGIYKDNGGCAGELSCGSDPLNGDDVFCGSGLGTYCIAVRGATCAQSGSTAFCCDSAVPSPAELKCKDGVWIVAQECTSGQTCGSEETFSVGCR